MDGRLKGIRPAVRAFMAKGLAASCSEDGNAESAELGRGLLRFTRDCPAACGRWWAHHRHTQSGPQFV